MSCLSSSQRAKLRDRVPKARDSCASTSEGAGWRHERNESFAYVRFQAGIGAEACTCGHQPIDGTRVDTALRQRLMNATLLLGQLYRRTLGSTPDLIPNVSTIVTLSDFDGNRARCLGSRRRDSDGTRVDERLHRAPPPLVPHAFEGEHAVAAPTFTWDVGGWDLDYQPSDANSSFDPFEFLARRAQLIWRGGVGALHANRGRTNLIAAAARRPDLIDAHATDASDSADAAASAAGHFCDRHRHRRGDSGDGSLNVSFSTSKRGGGASSASSGGGGGGGGSSANRGGGGGGGGDGNGRSSGAGQWYMPLQDQRHYRLTAATQGFLATPSWRVRRLFEAGFAVLMERHETLAAAWYMPFLRTNIDFLGVDLDFGDVLQRVEWANAHPIVTQQIARHGHEFANRMFNDACVASVLRLLLHTLAGWNCSGMGSDVNLNDVDEGWPCPPTCVYTRRLF